MPSRRRSAVTILLRWLWGAARSCETAERQRPFRATSGLATRNDRLLIEAPRPPVRSAGCADRRQGRPAARVTDSLDQLLIDAHGLYVVHCGHANQTASLELERDQTFARVPQNRLGCTHAGHLDMVAPMNASTIRARTSGSSSEHRRMAQALMSSSILSAAHLPMQHSGPWPGRAERLLRTRTHPSLGIRLPLGTGEKGHQRSAGPTRNRQDRGEGGE